MFIAACYRRFEIDPAAMQRARCAAGGFRLRFSLAASLALQHGGEARALVRIIAKECLQCRISNALSGLLKAFLTIFERFDQVINYFVLLLHKKIVAFHAAFACLLLIVNPSTIRLSGKSEWRGDAIFLRSNVRMLRMKFLAAQSERLDGIWLSILRSMGERPPTLCKDGATITSLRRGGLCCELSVAVLHR